MRIGLMSSHAIKSYFSTSIKSQVRKQTKQDVTKRDEGNINIDYLQFLKPKYIDYFAGIDKIPSKIIRNELLTKLVEPNY
jgi:hypothetical protein